MSGLIGSGCGLAEDRDATAAVGDRVVMSLGEHAAAEGVDLHAVVAEVVPVRKALSAMRRCMTPVPSTAANNSKRYCL